VRRRSWRVPSWRSAGLGARIFAAIALVILAGATTLLLVALVTAPVVFRSRLEDSGVSADSPLASHIDEGFTLALVTSITAAVLAASLVAVVVAAVIARRISRPIALAADSAGRLADGDYGVRIATPGVGPELDELAAAVNTLAQRLETAEQHRMRLLSDLGHELRTPLAALEATVAAIVDDILPADAETLGILTDQTSRLTRLTRDLQAVSRSDEHAFRLERHRVDVTALAEAAVAAQQARYRTADVILTAPPASVGNRSEPGTEAVHEPKPESAYAWADPDRVSEIVDQLLDNALRHCAAGDRVTVTVHSRGEGVGLIVTDTGTGFDPATANDLFTRFYRGPNTLRGPAGTGVGLTIARALAEAQHGTLEATSPGLGKGATFTLTVPAAQ
jgi:signal transduction histidine kinase